MKSLVTESAGPSERLCADGRFRMRISLRFSVNLPIWTSNKVDVCLVLFYETRATCARGVLNHGSWQGPHNGDKDRSGAHLPTADWRQFLVIGAKFLRQQSNSLAIRNHHRIEESSS